MWYSSRTLGSGRLRNHWRFGTAFGLLGQERQVATGEAVAACPAGWTLSEASLAGPTPEGPCLPLQLLDLFHNGCSVLSLEAVILEQVKQAAAVGKDPRAWVLQAMLPRASCKPDIQQLNPPSLPLLAYSIGRKQSRRKANSCSTDQCSERLLSYHP